MSKSHESYAVPQEDYRRYVHDYFFADPQRSDEREYYETRNLTFTNNFYTWFMSDDGYDQLDFGSAIKPVMENFREEYQDLWKRIKRTTIARRGDAVNWKVFFRNREMNDENYEAYMAKRAKRSEELKVRAERARSEAFDILAPQISEAGIDPLELCIHSLDPISD